MRHAAVLAVLVLVACGKSAPTAPPIPATPPPPVYPNMLGGWGGTQADTWIALDGSQPGGRTCIETWLITSQIAGGFSGAFQRSAGSSDACSRAGFVRGNVGTSGSLELSHADTAGTCQRIEGGFVSIGVLSPAGNITIGDMSIQRCPFGRGTIDLRWTTSVTLSRR